MKPIALPLSLLLLVPAPAIPIEKGRIPPGSKVYIQPMDGFDVFIVAAIQKKKVPVVVVDDRTLADFEITGDSQSQKAGWARTIFLAQTGSNEEASIRLVEIKTREVVFAYAVHKRNSVRGKQSSAEACAKHLKKQIRTEK